MIKRKLMESHINDECPMQKLQCEDCQNSVLRRDMNRHKTELCPQRLCECPFSKYGCDEQIKFKDLDTHLAQKEIYHLKLQVM